VNAAVLPPALDRPLLLRLKQLKAVSWGVDSSCEQLDLGAESRRAPRRCGALGTGKTLLLARLALLRSAARPATIHLQGAAGVGGSLPPLARCAFISPSGPSPMVGTVEGEPALTLDHSRSGAGRGGWRRERTTELVWRPLGRDPSFLASTPSGFSGGELQLLACWRA